ncbi:hypothetical protein WMY93_012812 [Mugilogobius chulae]|uniref:NACHT domain-containing protein n=1 Tax=Mugilogobius chulae TaxID=88201 RepID=A0AAW0PA06_9GOBI
MRSDRSKDHPLNLREAPPEDQREPGPKEQLDAIFRRLEKDVLTFVKEQLQRLHRLLASDYPECSESEEEEQSSREAVLNITLDFLRRMDQEQLAQRLQHTNQTVLTKGVAGVGKTVLTQKFSLDWAEGRANQELQLLFPFTFRELNVLRDTQFSLVELLHHFFSPSKALCSFQQLQVLFIFDGLDECRLPLDFSRTRVLSDPTESVSVDVLLVNLIRGSLLPSALLWITTRPAAANQIPAECVSMVTEVRGFTDLQKEQYFRKRFTDDTIISHIKSIRSLYIMSHIPVFCWILSTVIQKLLEQTEKPELPQTLTQMYVHFLVVQAKVQNIKYQQGSGADLHWTPETREMVLSLGKLAFEQLQKGNLIFYESDLSECGLDAAAASVYSGVFTQVFREEPGLYQDKVYCFIHLSLQEFLAALHVHQTFFSSGQNLLSPPHSSESPESEADFYCSAVDQALQSPNGHLDLFLRFLLGLLIGCGLSPHCCGPLASVLSSSSLTHLDLSHNDLQDSGAVWMSGLTKGRGYSASALSSAHSHLTELDLSYNHPGPSAELLTALRDDPHCPLDSLRSAPDSCEFSLDPNTAHRKLKLSGDKRTVTWVREKQEYPHHEDRFRDCGQVLSCAGLRGRCYWEVDWSGWVVSIALLQHGPTWTWPESKPRPGPAPDSVSMRSDWSKYWTPYVREAHSGYQSSYNMDPRPNRASEYVSMRSDWSKYWSPYVREAHSGYQSSYNMNPPGPGPESKPRPGPGPGSKPRPGPGPGSKPRPGPGPGSKPRPGPGPGSKPRPGPAPDSVSMRSDWSKGWVQTLQKLILKSRVKLPENMPKVKGYKRVLAAARRRAEQLAGQPAVPIPVRLSPRRGEVGTPTPLVLPVRGVATPLANLFHLREVPQFVLIVGNSHLRAIVDGIVPMRRVPLLRLQCDAGGCPAMFRWSWLETTSPEDSVFINNCNFSEPALVCLMAPCKQPDCQQDVDEAAKEFLQLLTYVTGALAEVCVVDFPPRLVGSVEIQTLLRQAYHRVAASMSVSYFPIAEHFPRSHTELWRTRCK